ncbi:SDR family NAD(P)-dependent oxidoreductase [Paenibacillus glucanolyticus]|uniref:SDR family NAD(P)-dependent oxidoreductase n=1 Tax=Paenibacillus glucanolyticus TaxID=59843 RepID=UPI0034CDEF9A
MTKVLITGAAGGIANALIRKLLEREYSVMGLDVSTHMTFPNVELYSCDLSDEKQISDLFNTQSESFSEVDAIVHLAGIYPNKLLDSYSVELWDKVHAVNVRSLFLVIKRMIELKDSKLKNVVITSSTAAKVGSRDPAYCSSKSALLGLAKSLSTTLAPKIRVNTILPGIVDTTMSQSQSLERRQFHINKTLAKYIGDPSEIADVILFLLSEESNYIWGAMIDVNGGMTI